MELFPTVSEMLDAHGVDPQEEPLVARDGYSGANLSVLRRGDDRFVVKRIKRADDLALLITHDDGFREVQFAVSATASELPAGTASPVIAAACDGDGRALLMRDLSEWMLVGEDRLTEREMDTFLARIAAMHAAYWGRPPEDASIGWCDVGAAMTCLGPTTGQWFIDQGRDFGMLRGWQTFPSVAPERAVKLVHALQADLSPLRKILDALPATLLHGDLKLGNAALDGDGTLWLIDWSLVMRAPVAHEIAWMLTINSSRLPWTLEDTIARYETHLRAALDGKWDGAQWQTQVHVVGIAGLLIYAWGKTLDHVDHGSRELFWWCERAEAAADALGW
jgi:hypothetical protein